MTDKDKDREHPAAHPQPATSRPGATVPTDLMTEQEKDRSGALKGVGPVSHSEVTPGPVETLEDLNIGPREPYPSGNPPPPSAADLANIEAAKKAPAPKVEPRKVEHK